MESKIHSREVSSKINEERHSFHSLDKKKILLVEDDITTEPIWNYIINGAYKKSTITWAINELEAEQLIEEAHRKGQDFDLVIADVYLVGDRTGLDLWKKYSSLLKDKIILISSLQYRKLLNQINTEKEKGTQNPSEMPQYIQKPLIPSECIDAVYRLLVRCNM